MLRAPKLMTAFQQGDSKTFAAQFEDLDDASREALANVCEDVSGRPKIPIASLVAQKIYELQSADSDKRAPYIQMLNVLIDCFADCNRKLLWAQEEREIFARPIFYLAKAVIESKTESSLERNLCFRLWAVGAGPSGTEYMMTLPKKDEAGSEYIKNLCWSNLEMLCDDKSGVSLNLSHVVLEGLSSCAWNDPGNRKRLSTFFKEFKGDDFKKQQNGFVIRVGGVERISPESAKAILKSLSGNAHIPELFIDYAHDEKHPEGFSTVLSGLADCQSLSTLRVVAKGIAVALYFSTLARVLPACKNLKTFKAHKFTEDAKTAEEDKAAIRAFATVPIECFEVDNMSDQLLAEYVAHAKALTTLRRKFPNAATGMPLLNYHLTIIDGWVVTQDREGTNGRWMQMDCREVIDNRKDIEEYNRLKDLLIPLFSATEKSHSPLISNMPLPMFELILSYSPPHVASLFRLAHTLQNLFPESIRDRVSIEPYIPKEDLGDCHGMRIMPDSIFARDQELTAKFIQAVFEALKEVHDAALISEIPGIIRFARALRSLLFDVNQQPVVAESIRAQLLPVYQAYVEKMNQQAKENVRFGIVHKAPSVKAGEKSPDIAFRMAIALSRAMRQVENIKPVLDAKLLESDFLANDIQTLKARAPHAVKQLCAIFSQPFDDKTGQALQCDFGDVTVQPKYDMAGMARILFTDESFTKLSEENLRQPIESLKKYFIAITCFFMELNTEPRMGKFGQDVIFNNLFVYPNFLQLHKIQKENIAWLVYVLKVLSVNRLLNVKSFNQVFNAITNEEKIYTQEHIKSILQIIPEMKDADAAIKKWEATQPEQLVARIGMHAAPAPAAAAVAAAASTPAPHRG